MTGSPVYMDELDEIVSCHRYLTCNPPEPHTRALLGSLRMEGSSDRKHVEDVTLG
ncbi:hypothetical protein PV328_003852, partial [Microctonus aethiopoides]